MLCSLFEPSFERSTVPYAVVEPRFRRTRLHCALVKPPFKAKTTTRLTRVSSQFLTPLHSGEWQPLLCVIMISLGSFAYIYLYNNPSYFRILIGSRLLEHRRTIAVIVSKFSPLCFKMAESFENNVSGQKIRYKPKLRTASTSTPALLPTQPRPADTLQKKLAN